MSPTANLLSIYDQFLEQSITTRFFKHADLLVLLQQLQHSELFGISEVGKSAGGRAIHLVKCGGGPCKVFLWSQMHGNEATATMALMDLFNYLGSDGNDTVKDIILQNCTLYILPMVNPDGAEIFSRRNAQDIDINRDFLSQQSPEGILLRRLRDEIKPAFGFNLHDQTTTWSAGDTGNPATISLLAPAYDPALSVNAVRQIAMQVVAEINESLQHIIPDHVARFDDEHEPRAFGDNFQAAGTSTILIEAGGYADDPEKQHIRKLVFVAIASGLFSISERTFVLKTEADYFAIPENKLHHFQILLRNCRLNFNGFAYTADVGLLVQETINEDLRSVTQTYVVSDIGDLSARYGYHELDCSHFTITQTQTLLVDEPADLIVSDGHDILLVVENGLLRFT